MALTRLPTEILEILVTHVLPEGFESVAMTCKRIYALYIPFIQHHNTLRSRFNHFKYLKMFEHSSLTILKATELIGCIAIQPIVARYIRYAKLNFDSPGTYARPHGFVEFFEDADSREKVVNLFKNSPYLKGAGLDWKEYLDKIEEDSNPHGIPTRYSQHAAAFLLTLLPNVERLTLPNQWKPNDATEKLVDAIVYKAETSSSLHDGSSLAQITQFKPCFPSGPQPRSNWDIAQPFLALPRLQYFRGSSCIAINGHDKSIVHTNPQTALERPLKRFPFYLLVWTKWVSRSCSKTPNASKRLGTFIQKKGLLDFSAGISVSGSSSLVSLDCLRQLFCCLSLTVFELHKWK